jgi:hypothetical protein
VIHGYWTASAIVGAGDPSSSGTQRFERAQLPSLRIEVQGASHRSKGL